MKVLILITKSNWGGAQRYVYDLAINLPKDNFDVEVIAGGNGVLIEKLIEAGIKANGELSIERDVNLFQDIKVFFTLISRIKKIKPEILHINSSKIGVLGAIAGRLTGVKSIVFTVHGWAFNENRSFISKIIIKFLHWLTIVFSHKSIFVSEALKKQTENWLFIDRKNFVVYNGIKNEPVFSKINSLYELSKLNSGLSDKLKSTKDTTIIGSVGELHHIKGYEYALRGLKDIDRKFLYLIISDGEDKEKIESDIHNLGLQNSVILLGRVPSVYQYLKAFDLFLMPSLSEGLPYVLLEAGLASLPVIATGVGGIPEIIDDMKSGILIQSRKAIEIKNAIEFYLKHKKIMKAHGIALHDKILADFSIEKMIQETIKIYRI